MFDGSMVKELRLRDNLTENALATMLGVSRSYINHIESGRRQPNLDHQKKLAGIFKVPVHQLYKKAAAPTKEPETLTQTESITSIVEQPSSSPLLVLTVPMLLSMVRGAQREIIDTACCGQRFQGTRNIRGQIEGRGLAAESNSFDLTITATEISLWMNTQISRSWMGDCQAYCEEPDVYLSDEKENTADHYADGLIWFTAYTSIYDQILRCIKLKDSTSKVNVLDSNLRSYVWRYEVNHERGEC